MKNSLNKLIPAIFLTLFMPLAGISLGRAEVVDKIVAVVNDDIITQREVDAVLFNAFTELAARYEGYELQEKLEQARYDAIQQLIDNKLVVAEARKQNIAVTDDEVNELLDETKRSFASEMAFKDALDSQNLRLIDLKQRYKEQLMLRKIIDRIIRIKVNLTPAELVEYYNSHIDQFKKPTAARAGLILIKAQKGSEPKEKIELVIRLLNELKSGADFEETAKKYSEGPNASTGGNLGFIKQGHMQPELDEAIFKLKEGEASDVIKTDVGYNIVKVYEIIPEETVTLEQARTQIEDELFKIKSKKALDEWLLKLRKGAYISIKY